MASIEIVFTAEHRRSAEAVALERTRESAKNGYSAKHGAAQTGSSKGLERDRLGAYGEHAWAIYLGQPMPTHVHQGKKPDIVIRRPGQPPLCLQARGVSSQGRRLIHRPGERIDEWFMLATIIYEPFRATVDGWLLGSECRKIGTWENENNEGQKSTYAWWVKRERLHDPASLLVMVPKKIVPPLTAADIRWG